MSGNGFLIDISVLSAFAPVLGRPNVHEQVVRWMKIQGEAGRLYLSVITLSEIRREFSKLSRGGYSDTMKNVAGWLSDLTNHYGDRLLPIDADVARIAGDREADAIAEGDHPDFAGVLIAATAAVHGLTVLTAQQKRFALLGVGLLNPLLQIPPIGSEDLNLPKPRRS
jgi:predicted nucleic acid-binding protein